MRSLETKQEGFWTKDDEYFAEERANDLNAVLDDLRRQTEGRLYDVELAMRMGVTIKQLHEAYQIDPWFLAELQALVDLHTKLVKAPVLAEDIMREAT